MLENIRNYLKQWTKSTEPRARLQQTYLVLAIGIITLAGVVSLFNVQTGRAMAGVAAAAIVVFLINAVVWALLQSVTLSYLTTSRTKSK